MTCKVVSEDELNAILLHMRQGLVIEQEHAEDKVIMQPAVQQGRAADPIGMWDVCFNVSAVRNIVRDMIESLFAVYNHCFGANDQFERLFDLLNGIIQNEFQTPLVQGNLFRQEDQGYITQLFERYAAQDAPSDEERVALKNHAELQLATLKQYLFQIYRKAQKNKIDQVSNHDELCRMIVDARTTIDNIKVLVLASLA